MNHKIFHIPSVGRAPRYTMILALISLHLVGCNDGRKVDDMKTSLSSAQAEPVNKAQSDAPDSIRAETDTISSEHGEVGDTVSQLKMGKAIYDKHRCATCHKLGGEGRMFGSSLDNLKTRYDAEKLAAFLRHPPYRSMPRFAGTEEELKPLVEFLLK